MRRMVLRWMVLLAPAVGPTVVLGDEPLGLRMPPGFAVTVLADESLANDIYRITIDPSGRVVVAGRGYIRTLVDDDGDGRADRAIAFADGPADGAMGLLWEGETLYVTGDGGLRRYRDRDRDGRADGPPELIRAMKTGGEHAAHAILRGPDGWLYVLCGNFTGIDDSFAGRPTSPIRSPMAGCVLRFSPDLGTSEVFADGFRNAYGMDFNAEGELFAFDSDNERCVSLPWYEPTRFYHVIEGGHHGWRAPQRGEFWRVPPYDPDVTPAIVTLGRGSPTGVACYRHTRFPECYRGGVFLLDWTFGKVHFVALERSGASYRGRSEVFLESVGSHGFAPTDVVVHPATGDLILSIGGRGTRGSVYRVRYTGEGASANAPDGSPIPIRPRSLDWRDGLRDELLGEATAGDDPARLRALIGLRRHRERIAGDDLRAAIVANWGRADRSVRRASADLIADLDATARRDLASRLSNPRERSTYALGISATDPAGALDGALEVIRDIGAGADARLDAVRAVQLALGDLTERKHRGTVWEGYSCRREPPWPAVAGGGTSRESTTLAVLRAAYPTGRADLDRELSRTLAMVQDDDPATLEEVTGRLTDSSDPVDDLHDLIVASRLRAPRPPGVTARVARALLDLDVKLTRRGAYRDRHWPLRVGELHAGLSRKDPALNAALLSSPEFGRPDHALFALSPGFDRRRAAEVFLARGQGDDRYAWSPELVELIGTLPPDRSLPVLRSLRGRGGLDDAILAVLARHPEGEDRSAFLEGLASPQWATVRLGLDALEALPVGDAGDRDERLVTLLRAMGGLPDGKEGAPMRERVARALRRLTGRGDLGADRAAWAAWLAETRPDLASRLGGDDVDLARWRDRLARVDWAAGESGRGRDVFARTGCATCHSGGRALGPDLRGVAGRFSRDDLFTAIVQPSRDVSARYRTALVATDDGQVYQGMVVYEAVDGLILQTGATTAVRLAGNRITDRRDVPRSLMPSGLIDKRSDREIADLYAYLKSLGAADDGPR